MATSGSQARWVSDITGLYDTLRSIQSTHRLTQSTIPSNPGLIEITQLSDLQGLIQSTQGSEHHLKFGCGSYTSPSIPSRGELIKPSSISSISSALSTLNSICHFDSFCSSDCSDFSSCDFCGGFSFSQSGCNSFSNT